MLALTFALAMSIHAPPPANPNPWEKAKQSDGITVWTREVPGSSIHEVKAEEVINVPPERVWAVLKDTAHYTEFMPYVVVTKLLGSAGDNAHYEYQKIDPPIVDNRDYTVRVQLLVDKQTGVRQRIWKAAPSKGPPPSSGTVRVTINQGSWTLTPDGKGKTQVVYYLYTDPGGSIPAWIANRANTTSVPALLRAVRNRSVNPTWHR